MLSNLRSGVTVVSDVNPNFGAPARMAHWVEFLKAVARMELRGIPFDVELATLIWEKRSEIRRALIGDVNALVTSGDIDNGKALALVASLAKDQSRHIVGAKAVTAGSQRGLRKTWKLSGVASVLVSVRPQTV